MLRLLSPVIIVLGTLCMTWVTITSIGALSVKLPYVALALVMLYAFAGPRKLTDTYLAARRNLFWIVPFVAYALLMGFIQIGTPAESAAPRQLFFLAGFVALAGCLAATPNLARTLRWGAALGLLLFVAAVEILASGVGLGWERAIAEFVQGNLNFVIYSFFRQVFNLVDPVGDPMGAAVKNEVAVGVLVLAIMFRSATANASRDFAGIAVMGVALVLLFLLNTRSVLLAAGASLLVAIIVRAFAQPGRSVPSLLLKLAAAIGLLIFAITSSLQTEGVSGVLSDRFAFSDGSTSARWAQFQAALEHIERHPFVGNGYFEVGGHVVHNLFLFAWVQGGLAAFLLAVVFYGGLLGSWIAFLRRAATRPHSWVLPIAPEWIATLPILPLLRMWQSGGGGNIFLGEWVALACFFGCCLANDLRVKAVVRAINQHRNHVSMLRSQLFASGSRPLAGATREPAA